MQIEYTSFAEVGHRMGVRASLIGLLALCVFLGVLRSDRLRTSIALDQPIQLTFWNGFTGPDGRTMLGLVRAFYDANPDVRVTMQRIPWGTYYNKLMVCALDGRGPEVFVLHASMIPRMARAGFVASVDERVDRALRDEFDARLLASSTDQGALLGLPLDVHPQGMYVNRAMLTEAGLVDERGEPRPPRDREEFLRAASRMKRESDAGVEQWGFGLAAWHLNFMSLVPQFGGRFLDETGEPTLDHPGNVEALAFLASMLQEHRLIPPPEGGVAGWIGFRQKRVAMVFDGIYMLGDLKRLEGHPYMGAPLPQIGPYPGTYGDSHVLCTRRDLDARSADAAWRFIRYLSDHSLEWAEAGQVPARRSVRDSEAFAALPVQSAFARQLEHVAYPPRTPSVNELQLHINLAVEKAIRGRATAAEALRQANLDYKRYLQRDRAEWMSEASP